MEGCRILQILCLCTLNKYYMDFDIEYKNIVFMIADPMEKISCER